MKTNKLDAALLWKQLDDVLVPRLGLNLVERVVYAHLLRHSRLEAKRQLRFSMHLFSRSVRLSDCTVRQAVRSLFRQRRITSAELEARLRALDSLAAGNLRPILLHPAVAPTKQRKS